MLLTTERMTYACGSCTSKVKREMRVIEWTSDTKVTGSPFSMAKWMCIPMNICYMECVLCVSVELLLPRGAEVAVVRFPHPICESCWIQHTMYWTRKRDLLQIIFTPVTMANRGGSDGMGFGFDFKAFNNSVIGIMWYSFVYFSWGWSGCTKEMRINLCIAFVGIPEVNESKYT